MRIYRSQELVAILVAPGNDLITEDLKLRECLGALIDQEEHSVQSVVRHLNEAGFTARGAYQMTEGPSNREQESQFFHTMPHHVVDIKMTTIVDSRPPADVKTDDATIQQLRAEMAMVLEQRGALMDKLGGREVEVSSLRGEIEKLKVEVKANKSLLSIVEEEVEAEVELPPETEPAPEDKSIWRKLWGS